MPARATTTSLADVDGLPDAALIRLRTVAALLGVSTTTIWRLARAGHLPPVRVSQRCTAWRLGDVRAYIDSLTSVAA
ncbi:MAG: helix-turn-helix domain-containing protein [Pseudomonadota bacterium]